MAVSEILAFYDGSGRDARGRTIEEIWSWDHRHLEIVHDFIQWLFPLPEPSRFNPDAPLLTPADREVFQSTPALQLRVRRSLDLMLDFLGLERRGEAVVRRAGFGATCHWLAPTNHNHLRLTRILSFLKYAGLKKEATALLACLEDIAAHEGKGAISTRTLQFWRAA